MDDVETKLSDETLDFFKQSRALMNVKGNEQPIKKLLSRKNIINCQDSQLKDAYENIGADPNNFDQSQLTQEDAMKAYNQIYRPLFIDTVKRMVDLYQQMVDCSGQQHKSLSKHLTSTQKQKFKKQLTELNNEWENCFTMHDFYIYKLTDEAMFHFRDSIIGLKRTEIIDIKKDQITYKKKKFKYEVCVQETYTNELNIKPISHDWLQENLDSKYWDYIEKYEDNKSWFIVSREDAKEDESELMKFQSFNYDIAEWKKTVKTLKPIYQYNTRGEDGHKVEYIRLYFKFKKKENGIDISTTEWFIRLSSYQKYLKQTHKEMDDLFGAPFIKQIYNEFLRIAQLERRRGSIENGRKHDVKDHAWDAHKQGLKNFLQMHYYHVGNAKPEFF